MDNLRDYVGWMGDYDFEAVPFGEVDAVILCTLAYYDFAPLFEDGSTQKRLRDGMDAIDAQRCPYTALAVRDLNYPALLHDAAASRRYGELVLSDYADIARANPPLQFSATTFSDGAGFRFVAFRGTDNTIAGWEEDFMISFTHTEAQERALDYARRQTALGRCRIGGHSKGGNLALYAACALDEDEWSLVEHVYLLDGPGLCPEVMDTSCVRRVNPRVTAIVPTFSVVGKLFTPAIDDTRVVRSSAHSILKHSIGSWGVDHGRLAEAPENDAASRWLNDVIQRWIDGIPQTDRATFVRELFGALSADGAATLADILKSGPSGLRAVLNSLINTSRTTKMTAAELPLRALLGENYDMILTRIFKEADKKV